jgi:hypothetical protein
VLADPRARKRERRTDLAVKRAFYRLADEKREIILVACSKCDWRAAFARDLIATHGANHPMPNKAKKARLTNANLDILHWRTEENSLQCRPWKSRILEAGYYA